MAAEWSRSRNGAMARSPRSTSGAEPLGRCRTAWIKIPWAIQALIDTGQVPQLAHGKVPCVRSASYGFKPVRWQILAYTVTANCGRDDGNGVRGRLRASQCRRPRPGRGRFRGRLAYNPRRLFHG